MRFQDRQTGMYCMNKGWRFSGEPYSVLPMAREHGDIYLFAKAGGVKGPAAVDFDDSDWQEVTLPHDWVTREPFSEQAHANHGYKNRGCGWYRMGFLLDKQDRDKQILLDFEGVTAEARIYVNGTLMKLQQYTYNSFTVDMTDVANFGTIPNVIAVFIDGISWEGWWYEGAGIYRNLWLHKKAAVHIAHNGVFVKPSRMPDGSWKVLVSVETENTLAKEQGITLAVELLGPDGEILQQKTEALTAKGMEKTCSEVCLEMEQPKIWDLDNPVLYDVRTAVIYDGSEKDYLKVPFGFRTISIDAESGFWLNGRNIKLKGTCNHHDHAGVGAAVPYSVKEYRIKKLLELGSNAYRCAHNPDPEVLDICDRLGMLVMNENRTFSSDEQTLREVEGIVRESRNHPCVVLYSVFNEEPWQGTEKGRRLATRLQNTIKKLDDTRPVLGSFNGGFLEAQGAASALETVGINYNPDAYPAFHKLFPNTPLIGSETASAFMVRGEYESSKERHVFGSFDTDFASWGNSARDAWKAVAEKAYVAGTFVWTGFDYRGEPTPYKWPSVASFFGIYDSCGFEKEACYLYQALWKEEPVVHLLTNWGQGTAEGEDVKVLVASNCEEIVLYIDDKQVASQEMRLYEQNEFILLYTEGVLRVEGYRGGVQVACSEKKPRGEKRRLTLQTSKSLLNADGLDAAIINLVVVDENGTICQDASEQLFFEVDNGIILGTGNGDPNSHEDDVADTRSLFHGCAQVIVKNTGKDDMIFRATGNSVGKAEIRIPVCENTDIPYIQPVRGRNLDGWRMYYKLFAQMPDIHQAEETTDMNSFEPVVFEGNPQSQFKDKAGYYGWYRTEFTIPTVEPGWKLLFGSVIGNVWIYLNEELLIQKSGLSGESLEIALGQNVEGAMRLSVVLQHAGEKDACGIIEPVTLLEE